MAETINRTRAEKLAAAKKAVGNKPLEAVHNKLNQQEDEKERAAALKRAEDMIKKLKKEKINVPIDVFPLEIQEFILNYYNHYKYPISYYFGSVLSVAGTAIGNAYSAQYHEGWEGVGMTWIINVGGSGVGKSQVQKHCISPFLKIQERQVLQNDSEVEELKESKRNVKEEDLPTPSRIFTSKSTNERLIGLLKENPKGILLARSEIRGWIKSMNQYSRGDDAENFMEWWDNQFWSDDKKGAGYVSLQCPFISVLGGIQSKIVKQMGAGDNSSNGFFQRLLFCIPVDDKKPMPKKGKPKKEPYLKYEKAIIDLFDLPNLFKTGNKNNRAGHERIISCKIPLSNEAEDVYFNYLTSSAKKANETEDDVVKSLFAKLETYVLRFAIILEMLDYIFKKDKYPNTLIKMVADGKYKISAKTIKKAIKVADYFEQTGKKITDKLGNPVADLSFVQQSWYENLPEHEPFRAKFALERAAEISKKHRGIGTRTVKELLRNRQLFNKVRNLYERIY